MIGNHHQSAFKLFCELCAILSGNQEAHHGRRIPGTEAWTVRKGDGGTAEMCFKITYVDERRKIRFKYLDLNKQRMSQVKKYVNLQLRLCSERCV